MTPRAAISVRRLRKAYGDRVVLDDLDLDVDPGTVLALLGPNGVGKTTTVKILCTLTAPDAGEVTVGGFDLATEPHRIRECIGVTGQFSAVDNLLTGIENLRLMADLHHLGRSGGRRRVAEMVALMDLGDAAGRPASTYSGGMRRRLDLAMTLVGRPAVLFLDEPTTGLDPRSRREMWRVVEGLVADGTSVLLTTQYLDEADRLAHRVAVLDGGRIVAEGTPEELKRSVPGAHVRLDFDDAAARDRAESALAGSRRGTGLSLGVPSDGSGAALRDLLDRLAGAGVEVPTLSVRTPDLDDVFLALTGHAPAEPAPDGAPDRSTDHVLEDHR